MGLQACETLGPICLRWHPKSRTEASRLPQRDECGARTEARLPALDGLLNIGLTDRAVLPQFGKETLSAPTLNDRCERPGRAERLDNKASDPVARFGDSSPGGARETLLDAVVVETIVIKTVVVDAVGVEADAIDAVAIDAVAINAVAINAVGIKTLGVEAVGIKAVGINAVAILRGPRSPFTARDCPDETGDLCFFQSENAQLEIALLRYSARPIWSAPGLSTSSRSARVHANRNTRS